MDFNTSFDLYSNLSDSFDQSLGKTAAYIALNNFQWRYVTLLMFNYTILSGVSDFVKSYDKSVVISKGDLSLTNPGETRQYVIYSNTSEMLPMLQMMQRKQFYNIGKYIIVCQSDHNHCNETRAVEILWQHHIINVVFLKQAADEKVIGYTYFFDPKTCANGPPVKLNDIDQCTPYKSSNHCRMFPAKMENLNRCTIIASTFIQAPYMHLTDDGVPYGVDGDLLRVLAEAINATLKMRTPHRGDGWGEFTEDGEWIGSLGDLEEDLANLSITYGAITMLRFEAFQLSIPYGVITIGWVTHPTKLESSSLKLQYPFEYETHFGVAFVFMLVVSFDLFVKSKFWPPFGKTFDIPRYKRITFHFYMVSLGLPVKKLPRKRVILFVVYCFIWYCFLIRTSYQASLVNSLKSDRYQTNFDTLKELLENNYKFGGGGSLKELYRDDSYVYNNWIHVQGGQASQSWLYQISKGMKATLAINLEHPNLIQRQLEGKFHILPHEKIMTSPTVMFFKKFSPISEQINIELRRLTESGFIDKFYKNNTLAKKSVNSDDRTLTIEHYHGCYAILAIGFLMSVMALCYEMFYFKCFDKGVST